MTTDLNTDPGYLEWKTELARHSNLTLPALPASHYGLSGTSADVRSPQSERAENACAFLSLCCNCAPALLVVCCLAGASWGAVTSLCRVMPVEVAWLAWGAFLAAMGLAVWGLKCGLDRWWK